MGIVYTTPSTVKTEGQMQKALLHHFDWQRNDCYWNTQIFHWESDFLVVSDAGYVQEVEIKTSFADWKNDADKDKFTKAWAESKWKYIKKFWYAVPADLLAKHGLPPNLVPTAGVLTVTPRPHGRQPVVKVVIEAQRNTDAVKLPDSKKEQLQRSLYFKAINGFLKKF